jgi:hypothetical protein
MQRLQILRTLCTICFLLPASLTATPQQPVPASPDENRAGTISGTVVNESGQPLIGVIVSVRPTGPPVTGRTAVTDTEGSFRIAGLDNGIYYISASSPAYVSPPFDIQNPLPTYRVGDTVRLELIRGGVITGTLTNAAGEPMVGIRVRASMVRYASGKPTNGSVFLVNERTTDDRGIYRLYGLAPGTYLVMAGGGGPQSLITSTDLDAPTFAPSSTRDTAAEIQVRGGEEVTADIRYRAEPGHSISGMVKTQGTTGASISVMRAGDEMVPSNGSYQSPGSRGFTIYGLADGEYDLIAQEAISSLGVALPDLAMSDPFRVTIRGADVNGVELVPKPLASISGKVVLEPSRLPNCQNRKQPLFSETVIAIVANPKDPHIDQSTLLRSMLGAVTADKDGSFTLKNIRHGQYAFSPRFYGRYWYLKSMAMGSTSAQSSAKQSTSIRDVTKNWTPVKSGDRLTGLIITLTEGAASIRGQLTVTEGEKNEFGMRVYLVPAERDKADDPLRYFTQDIAGDGAFALSGVQPGRYLIFAEESRADFPTSTEKLRLPDAVDARLKIRSAAELQKTELELKPCQNLTDYRLKAR